MTNTELSDFLGHLMLNYLAIFLGISLWNISIFCRISHFFFFFFFFFYISLWIFFIFCWVFHGDLWCYFVRHHTVNCLVTVSDVSLWINCIFCHKSHRRSRYVVWTHVVNFLVILFVVSRWILWIYCRMSVCELSRYFVKHRIFCIFCGTSHCKYSQYFVRCLTVNELCILWGFHSELYIPVLYAVSWWIILIFCELCRYGGLCYFENLNGQYVSIL
jgi:hypothetical protein